MLTEDSLGSEILWDPSSPWAIISSDLNLVLVTDRVIIHNYSFEIITRS